MVLNPIARLSASYVTSIAVHPPSPVKDLRKAANPRLCTYPKYTSFLYFRENVRSQKDIGHHLHYELYANDSELVMGMVELTEENLLAAF